MARNFIDLDVNEIKLAINRAADASIIVIKDEVFIAEADVLICQYKNLRVNVKVDLVYGAVIEPVDKLTTADVDEIKDLIVRNLDP